MTVDKDNLHTKAASLDVTADREVRFIASDESVDRYGDIIRVDGWELANFKRNPVLLFGHNSRDLPIGQVSSLETKGKQLIATARFLPEGVYDFADTVWRVVKAGVLKAVSVGFVPTKQPNMIRDEKNDKITGFEYIGQELLELSVVPIPANPAALAISKSLNIESRLVDRLFGVESASAFLAHRRREIDLIRLRVRSD